MKTPFEILEVAEEASDEEIKKAYLQKVRQYPPERAPERFQEVRGAFEMLQNKQQRLKYQLFHYAPPQLEVIIERALRPGKPQRLTADQFLQALTASLHRNQVHG